MQTPPSTPSGGGSSGAGGYSPGDVEPYGPAYGPTLPEYGPGPEPGETREDYERRAIDFLNERADRFEETDRERYRGLFGRITGWFDREGRRQRGETLDEVAEWERNPTWKKWAKIGAKVAGGFGIAAAMAFTGGAGAVLTPILWTAGMREGWDGALQLLEKGGFGRGRTQAEVARQENLNQRITELKQLVRGGEITPERFQQALDVILDAERQAMEQIETNMTSERRWKMGRAIASTVLTIGTGVITGVPLGTASYAKEATGQATHLVGHKSSIFLDESHKVFWNFRGGQFLYNSPGEFTNAAQFAAQNAAPWTLHGEHFWQASHILGHGLPKEAIAGLWGSGIYLAGRWLAEYLPGGGRRRRPYGTTPYYSSYGSYSSYGGRPPYMPSPPYGPRSPELSTSEEREALQGYLDRQNPDYIRELNEQNDGLEPMSERCRFSVCIPAAYAEHPNIYRTLSCYLGQKDMDGNDLDPETFEVLVFVNGPRDQQTDIDKTVAEVQKFQREHPEIKVRVVSKAYAARENIGAIRKHVNDLALMRSLARTGTSEPLYLVSNDADVVKLEQQYLAKAMMEFQNNPDLKMIAGKGDFDEAEYSRYPYLLAARRLWQIIDIVSKRRAYGSFKPKALGFNSFMRAQSYALAGGYRPGTSVAEDLRMSDDISAIAGRNAVQYRNIEAYSNPRRDIDAIERGIPIVDNYRNFGATESLRTRMGRPVALDALRLDSGLGERRFRGRLEREAGAMFETIRGQFFWGMFDRHADMVRARRAGASEAEINRIRDRLSRDDTVGGEASRRAGRIFRRAMRLWGVPRYELTEARDGRIGVRFRDWTRLRSGLERRAGGTP